jgi:hypothetical protein
MRGKTDGVVDSDEAIAELKNMTGDVTDTNEDATDHTNAKTHEATLSITARVISVFFESYTADRYWWEVVVMGKKLIFTGLILLASERWYSQSVIGVAVAAASIWALEWGQPYGDRATHYLAQGSMVVVLIIQLFGVALLGLGQEEDFEASLAASLPSSEGAVSNVTDGIDSVKELGDDREMLGALLIALNTLFVVWFSWVLCISNQLKQWRERLKTRWGLEMPVMGTPMQGSGCPAWKTATIVKRFLQLPPSVYATSKDCCFCGECGFHDNLDDTTVDFSVDASNSSHPHISPSGWCGFGLNAPANASLLVESGHVSFHATFSEAVKTILSSVNPQLLYPGLQGDSGVTIPIRPGHVDAKGERLNLFTGENELFDPNQIFTSPSIKYLEVPGYYTHTESTPDGIQFQLAFQCRQQSGSYTIGQETIGATARGIKIDSLLPNNALEWYTKRIGTVVLTRLLIKVVGPNVSERPVVAIAACAAPDPLRIAVADDLGSGRESVATCAIGPMVARLDETRFPMPAPISSDAIVAAEEGKLESSGGGTGHARVLGSRGLLELSNSEIMEANMSI